MTMVIKVSYFKFLYSAKNNEPQKIQSISEILAILGLSFRLEKGAIVHNYVWPTVEFTWKMSTSNLHNLVGQSENLDTRAWNAHRETKNKPSAKQLNR